MYCLIVHNCFNYRIILGNYHFIYIITQYLKRSESSDYMNNFYHNVLHIGKKKKNIIATLGSILDSQQSLKSRNSQHARWSHRVALFWWNHPATRSPSFSNRSNDYWEPVLMCGAPPRGPQNIFCLVSNVFPEEFVLWNAWLLL